VRNRHRRNAEELAALLDGRLSPDEVTGEARRLATLATTMVEERPGPVATLTEDRRLAMRDRLMDDIAALDAPAVAAPVRDRRPARTRAAIASGVASALIAGTGVTVAAQEALPGDVLYGLKKGTESVRMSLASDATQAARLELRFAEERLEEVTAGVRRVPAGSLVDSLAEMDQRSIAGAQQLVLDAERTGEGELLAEVDSFVERQSTGIIEIFARLPIEVRPHAEDSLATLRQIRSDLLLPALEACDCIDIVPASHSDDFLGRMTSDPLPPAPASSEPSQPDESEAKEEGSTSDSDSTELEEPLSGITSERSTSDSDGVGSKLLEPLGETGSKVGDTVDDTVDSTVDGLNSTTDGSGEIIDEAGEVVDDTTETLADTVDKTTDSVGDLLGSTTDSVDKLLGR
jgi:hypothetical protein